MIAVNARKLALLILGLSCLSLLCAAPSHAAQKRKRGKQASSKAAAPVGGTRGKVLATIDAFEKAYQRKDKNTMLLKLMYPTTDKNLLNKRYQWLRGYGVDEVPAANRPPILFITAAGSYVPKTYKVISANPTSSANWTAVVEETGSCQEEGKRFSVKRRRTVTLAGMNGKWYIDNYFNPENPDEYGFWVDDITDEMKQTH
jgi:hypothetical protein